ncbi:MAG TPA: ion channel [Polyangiaceae bacterium]
MSDEGSSVESGDESETDYEIRVVGAPRAPLRDLYHGLLRISWPLTIALVVGGYLAVSALFALGYLWTGGVSGARPGSFRDALYFSVETQGTIGYGVMSPVSDAANTLMVVQSTLGLLLTALAAGLIVSKFSRPNARLQFSRQLTISPVNGVPTLSFRISNLRSNRIVEAQIHVALTRTEQTLENQVFYRMIDLKLGRERALSLARSWTVQHVIDAESPLRGETPRTCAQKDVEVLVTVVGLDDIWMQTVHAGHRYTHRDMLWGARHVDVLSAAGDVLTLDLTKFHDTEPTAATPEFPYGARK